MSVTIILPDNKRLNIKVTFNSLLSEVLEKVCIHKGLDSGSYTLQRNNRAVDLGLSLRLASIPLNSELNLVFDANKKVNQQVSLSVQFEDRPRRTGQFTSADTLWHVIETLFTADCPEIADDNLVLSINFMNRQFEGKETLSNTTLKLIGILSGRQMLRMNSRPKEAKSTQKFVENIKFKKPEPIGEPAASKSEAAKSAHKPEPMDLSIADDSKGSTTTTPSEPTTAKSETFQAKKDPSPAPEEASSEPAKKFAQENLLLKQLKSLKENTKKSEGTSITLPRTTGTTVNLELLKEVKYLGGQNEEILYSFEDSPQFVEENVSDDFFEHTSGDLKHLLTALKRQQAGDSQSQLETQKTREERERLEREKYQQTIIRVVFPYDRLILQAIFKPTDTIGDIISVLSKYTAHPDQIYLFTAPPKTVLSTGARLFDLKLIPSGLIYCGTGNLSAASPTVIKQQYKAQVTAYSLAANLSLHQMKSIFLKSKEKKPF